ncbi:tRNA(fMet)-specific endonuclease VapC [bacterium HR16]|nr:tRNA(fMet)-specific endonuclease VapC [bacterium HR16]
MMTSSSDVRLERGLDTVILVYSLLEGHPASSACEQFLRSRTGWFLSSLSLLEATAVLHKVYGVPVSNVHKKLVEVCMGPISVLSVDEWAVLEAIERSEALRIDLTDAVLLVLAIRNGVPCIATEDEPFARACQTAGLKTEAALDEALRQQVAEWEEQWLPAKGLPRVLRQIERWLFTRYPEVAREFRSITGECSHLP